jgi:hypothetical protein
MGGFAFCFEPDGWTGHLKSIDADAELEKYAR